ncbi:hypothetical protein OIE49_04625 [Streptomyces sp. NBC_01788]|uniref:hypothetical protein n=1 Tax=unclassified Streptomyces TaxID=2593676 RepID=UPI002DDA4301|nr:hypothetical protein [Streptomyces sp. NBC_01788]WSB25218.1 hypothetical protein OIE49_04625 [Streptomyces sp. NBC_01788]
MRYAQGGGLTKERRVFHEKLRVEAAERFVPERERGRAGVHVLDAVRRCVGRTLDPAATGDEFAGAVVPAFADIAVVEVVDCDARRRPAAGPAAAGHTADAHRLPQRPPPPSHPSPRP